jgi:hypothetical protein
MQALRQVKVRLAARTSCSHQYRIAVEHSSRTITTSQPLPAVTNPPVIEVPPHKHKQYIYIHTHMCVVVFSVCLISMYWVVVCSVCLISMYWVNKITNTSINNNVGYHL